MKIESQYKKYIDLKSKIATLEEELKEVGDILKQDIIDNGEETVLTSYGSFYLIKRKKWQYSPAVLVLESSLKEARKEEEQTGLAKAVEETVSLAFRVKK